jgi:hypothetical protein
VFVPEGPDDGGQAWNAPFVSDGGQSVAPQIMPFPTGPTPSALYQTFHAWLPSFRPSGNKFSLEEEAK